MITLVIEGAESLGEGKGSRVVVFNGQKVTLSLSAHHPVCKIPQGVLYAGKIVSPALLTVLVTH